MPAFHFGYIQICFGFVLVEALRPSTLQPPGKWWSELFGPLQSIGWSSRVWAGAVGWKEHLFDAIIMQSVDVEAGDVFTFADLWFLIGVLDRSIRKIQKATFFADLWCVTVACGQDRFNVNADQLDSFLQQLQAGHTGYLDQPLFKFFQFLKAQCFPKPPWVYVVLYLYLPVCSRWWSIFPSMLIFFSKKLGGFPWVFPEIWWFGHPFCRFGQLEKLQTPRLWMTLASTPWQLRDF